nr:hypothetical protein [Tanacetum cinerariifolium]
MQELKDLTPEEKTRKSCGIKATNIILLGLLSDIYTLVNHHKIAKDRWNKVKEIMKGTELTKQERESKLYDEFDRFTSEKRESIHSYYLRYAKLINGMNIIEMKMTPIQINMKFLNHLEPEWSRFVTATKQAKNLYEVNFDQLYAYLKQNENDANKVRTMRQRFPDPLALLSHTYNPPPHYINQKSQVTVQNVHGRQSQGYRVNIRKGKATGTWVINTVRDLKANLPRVNQVLQLQREDVDGTSSRSRSYIAGRATRLLADGLEDLDSDCDDLQLHTTSIFKAYHVDAFDSDCDEVPMASAIFMARLSPAGSVNGDVVGPTYDSDILSEVPHYDTYHEIDMLNHVVQETEYSEHLVSSNDSYDEPMSDNNVIAMKESSWIEAIQEEIHEFEELQVWELVLKPSNVMPLNLTWVFKVKLDEYRGVLKNKAWLKKALYGLKQALRAWYDLLSKYLQSQKFVKGAGDSTLFTRKEGKHILLKYGLENSDAVDTPMVERSKLDEDPQRDSS